MKKNKKVIFEAVFLVALLGLTCYYLFRNHELSEMLQDLKYANNGWLLLGIMLVVVFIGCEALIIHHMLNQLDKKIPYHRCFCYSVIGFFYSAVTPSASGGQPMQMLYMKKDKIPLSVSWLIMLIITISYKFVLLFAAVMFIVFQSDFIMGSLKEVRFVLYYGIIANAICIIFLILLVVDQRLAYIVIEKLVQFAAKIHLLKNKEKTLLKVKESIKRMALATQYIKEHKLMLIRIFLITFIQRMSLFFVTYAVYRSFGLNGVSPIRIVALQTMISLGVDMLPLPGGIGASESGFNIIFTNIFTSGYLFSGLLISRGISFYLPLLLSGIYVMTIHGISIARTKWQKKG